MKSTEINQLQVGDYVIWLEDAVSKPYKLIRKGVSKFKFEEDMDWVSKWQLEGDDILLCDKEGNAIKRNIYYEIY